MTPQHHIIKETSESLARLFQDEFKRSGYKRVHMIEKAPKPDSIDGKLPAVTCYLYQVSLDTEGVDGNVGTELVEVEGPDGTIEEYRRRRRLWIRLDYLMATWAQTPEDEQLLLGLIIRTIIDNPTLPRKRLRGDTFEDDFELPLVLSTRLEEGTHARFWQSLQQPVRPAVQAWTTIPIVPEAMAPFKRVERREVSFRNINDPRGRSEKGPERSTLTRRDLNLGER